MYVYCMYVYCMYVYTSKDICKQYSYIYTGHPVTHNVGQTAAC
jgi:hypothetical protein